MDTNASVPSRVLQWAKDVEDRGDWLRQVLNDMYETACEQDVVTFEIVHNAPSK